MATLDDVKAESPINNGINAGTMVIKLNVGGSLFTTTKQTLLNVDDCYFAKRFGGNFAMGPKLNDAYFIDRDPTHFRVILNFLRDGRDRVILPKKESALAELLNECEFYNLTVLQKMTQRKWYESPKSRDSLSLIAQSMDDVADNICDICGTLDCITNSIDNMNDTLHDLTRNGIVTVLENINCSIDRKFADICLES
eukprot:387563_1